MSSSRFKSCQGTSACKRPSVTWVGNARFNQWTGTSTNKFAIIPSVRGISLPLWRWRVENLSGYSLRICVESEFSWEILAPAHGDPCARWKGTQRSRCAAQSNATGTAPCSLASAAAKTRRMAFSEQPPPWRRWAHRHENRLARVPANRLADRSTYRNLAHIFVMV